MTIREICSFLEEKFPPALQEDYDNTGLLIGFPDDAVSGVLLALDVTSAVLEEAVEKGCNVVIAHHPLIFRGIRKITGNDQIQRMISFAIKNDLAVVAVHTNLDNSINGLNQYLAEKLGITDLKILMPKQNLLQKLVVFCPEAYAEKLRNAMFAAGAGHIGNYDQCSYNLSGEGTFRANEKADPFVGEKNKIHFEKEVRVEVIVPSFLTGKVLQAMLEVHPYEEPAYDIYPLRNDFPEAGSGITGKLTEAMTVEDFFSLVKKVTGIPVIRYSHGKSNMISCVALCTGSGSFIIGKAEAAGADILLTADLKYHDFQESGKMIVADIGHFESEQFAKELLYEVLTKKFPNFAFFISKIVTNPVNYF